MKQASRNGVETHAQPQSNLSVLFDLSFSIKRIVQFVQSLERLLSGNFSILEFFFSSLELIGFGNKIVFIFIFIQIILFLFLIFRIRVIIRFGRYSWLCS
jgi:hypothetical protein